MLGDDIDLALPEMRAQAESMMHDTCIVTRATGGNVWDEATGTYTVADGSLIYSGPCRVQDTRATEANNVTAGETKWTLTTYVVSVPFSAAQAAVGDFVTVTSARYEPQLVGRRFTVTTAMHKTHATARRLSVKEVT